MTSSKPITEFFAVGVPAILKHMEKIYSSRELKINSTISILEKIQTENSREEKRIYASRANQFRFRGNKSLEGINQQGILVDNLVFGNIRVPGFCEEEFR